MRRAARDYTRRGFDRQHLGENARLLFPGTSTANTDDAEFKDRRALAYEKHSGSPSGRRIIWIR
jgi:hypothetical protein